MDYDNGDILHQGWLTKSPPLETKKQLFNQSLITPKWRRRWFVLRQGGMPGQFLLQYFTDPTTKKLKGTIDLDQCEQVDTGLTYQSAKIFYQHMFDIKTPRRIFYLAADSELEMTAWVDCICQVCGLRTYQAEEDQPDGSRPKPDTSFISGPYMHLSDCFSGTKQPPGRATKVPPPQLPPARSESPQYQNNTAETSLNCGDDSVFLPTTPSTRRGSSSDHINSRKSSTDLNCYPPGRPPKPDNLRSIQVTETIVTSPPSSAIVSNAAPPPLINRNLKPERRVDGMSTICPVSSLPPPPAPIGLPPPVQRGRKPVSSTGDAPHGMWIPGDCSQEDDGSDEELEGLCNTLEGRRDSLGEEEEEQIFFYMPSLQQTTGGRWDPLMIPASEVVDQQVEYLDLDLKTSGGGQEVVQPDPPTVYKTVDFVKTEAFNRTRIKVEEYKYNIKPEGK